MAKTNESNKVINPNAPNPSFCIYKLIDGFKLTRCEIGGNVHNCLGCGERTPEGEK